jgi:hypothetical protein
MELIKKMHLSMSEVELLVKDKECKVDFMSYGKVENYLMTIWEEDGKRHHFAKDNLDSYRSYRRL